MTSYVDTLLVKHVKLSSIDEAQLARRQVSLDDSLSLLQSLSKEFNNDASNAKFAECVGVMAILTTVVSDIVRDTVGVAVSKTNKLMDFGLKKGYDKARAIKWKDNRYEDLIKSIENNGGYLENLAKLDKSGMTTMVVVTHKHMLMNFIGLKCFTEDSKEARMALSNAIRSLEKTLKHSKNNDSKSSSISIQEQAPHHSKCSHRSNPLYVFPDAMPASNARHPTAANRMRRPKCDQGRGLKILVSVVRFRPGPPRICLTKRQPSLVGVFVSGPHSPRVRSISGTRNALSSK